MMDMIKSIDHSLEDIIDERTKELKLSREDTILKFIELAEKMDNDTCNHTKRIGKYSRLFALKSGLDKSEAKIIGQASLLHDIGKIGIDDQILRKPGQLDLEEFEIMKTHTTIGAKILGNSDTILLSTARDIACYHHEQWCGKGYPYGLSGEDIPLSARIVAIVDTFDALLSERVYKHSWTLDEVVAYLENNKGILFDPNLIDVFIGNIDLFVKIEKKYNY